jgi:hypothetical protein
MPGLALWGISGLDLKPFQFDAVLASVHRAMHELEGEQREAMNKIENLIWFPKTKASGEPRHDATTFVAHCCPVAAVPSS